MISWNKFVFLVLFVDDILLDSIDLRIVRESKEFLSINFEIKDIDQASYVIWIEIFYDRSQGL